MLLVGWQEGHPACKILIEWWGTGMVICLERDADLHVAQLMPLPLTVSCFSKIRIGFTFLVPAHPGSPGKRAIKRVCVCVCYHFSFLLILHVFEWGMFLLVLAHPASPAKGLLNGYVSLCVYHFSLCLLIVVLFLSALQCCAKPADVYLSLLQ